MLGHVDAVQEVAVRATRVDDRGRLHEFRQVRRFYECEVRSTCVEIMSPRRLLDGVQATPSSTGSVRHSPRATGVDVRFACMPSRWRRLFFAAAPIDFPRRPMIPFLFLSRGLVTVHAGGTRLGPVLSGLPVLRGDGGWHAGTDRLRAVCRATLPRCSTSLQLRCWQGHDDEINFCMLVCYRTLALVLSSRVLAAVLARLAACGLARQPLMTP